MIEIGVYLVFTIIALIIYLIIDVSIDMYMLYVLFTMFLIQTFKGGDNSA